MNNLKTADRGIEATRNIIEKLGGKNVQIHKEGNKRYITFTANEGRNIKITTRAKKSGTWQTMTTYGRMCKENASENEYWVFIDLEHESPKFYPVPLWWISNNIYEVHQMYLKKHGGHRKENDNSTHHAVPLKRIKSWENQWEIMGLQANRE